MRLTEDAFLSSGFSYTPAAIAGYPIVTGEFDIPHMVPTYILHLRPLPHSSNTPTPTTNPARVLRTVPLGFQPDTVKPTPATPVIELAPGLPFGLAFVGTAFSESALLGYAFAFEQATHARLERRAFSAAVPRTQLADVIGKQQVNG